MQTNDLINALKADSETRALPLRYAWWVALVVATIIAGVAFWALIGPRPDFAAATHTLRFLFKFILTLVLTVVAFVVLRVLSRPGSNIGGAARWLFLIPVLVVASVAAEIFAVPPDQLGTVWWGSNVYVCLTFIPLIGLGPLTIFLAALRYAAPTRPRLASAVAGLLAGGIAATFYAAHCPDDSPLFVATWYSIAIAGLVVLGTICGRYVVRW